jgi:hypothetical protein
VIRNLDHHVNGQRFGPSNINDQKIGWEFSKKKSGWEKWIHPIYSPQIRLLSLITIKQQWIIGCS